LAKIKFEKKRFFLENEELNGQIVAEREKNNILKHENESLKLDQTRNRETMHQQANLIEFVQRQNQELTPQKKKGNFFSKKKNRKFLKLKIWNSKFSKLYI